MAALLPMDGYHFDDLHLVPAGLRPRKGAPETFDVGGLRHMLMRLRANEEDAVAAPGGTTYYIAPHGNDSASGTSPSQPLKTLGRVESLDLQPGDKVLLQRGASFTGKLGVWKSGSAVPLRSTAGSNRSWWRAASTSAATPPTASSAPLGRPVVPEV